MRRTAPVLTIVLVAFAASAHAELTPEQTKQAEALIRDFGAEEFHVRRQATEKAIAMGMDILPMVKKTLAEADDPEVRARCEMVIDGVMAALVGGLTSGDDAVRAETVRRLILIGPKVLPHVRRAMAETPEPKVRTACMRVIRYIETGQSPPGVLVGLPAVGDARAPREHLIGDFETGTLQGWQAWYATKLTVQEDKRAHGKRWLRVELTTNPWPGLGVHYSGPQDWSRYRAVRFSVFNPGDRAIALHVRADDMLSTHADYTSRYNDDVGGSLQPGANDVEVTLASLRTGSPGCRGLDVTTIRLFRMFLGEPKERHTLYLDHVRLVPVPAEPPRPLVLADFDGKGKARWRAAGAGRVTREKRPDDANGSALKIIFGGGRRPGVEFHDFDGDWLAYDLLCLDIICPKGKPMPRQAFLNVKGADGAPHWLYTDLKEGVNRLEVPLALTGAAPLGNIRSLAVVGANGEGEPVAWIDNVRLKSRGRLTDGKPVHPGDRADAPLDLDFRKLQSKAFFSVGAVTWVPLKSGETRIVHCTQPGRGAAGYALRTESLEDIDPAKPIRVWGYVRSKEGWRWSRREVRLKDGDPLSLDFNDLAPPDPAEPVAGPEDPGR